MNRHWRLETDDHGIAWLHFDQRASTINLLSRSALETFAGELERLEKLALNGLVILSDKPGGFIAGADLTEFRQLSDPQQVETQIRRVHRLLQRLEELPYPTLALIHGYCVGGGLELALACRYRIARDDPDTRLGFPEIRLGLFPGYGGSVRSIEHIGPLPALRLMLEGRSLDSRGAQRLGLVDRIAPQRQLRSAASRLLQQCPPPQRAPLQQRLLNLSPARQLLAFHLRRRTAKRVDPTHYPAPFTLIDHWQRDGGNRTAQFEGEAHRLGQLLLGKTAQNLIRVFFLQERLKSLGSDSDFQTQHVHLVGGGRMGGDIAAWCALQGLRVSLQDRTAQDLCDAVARAHELFTRKLESPLRIRAARDRLLPDPRGYGVAKADLVIEAVTEDLETKQALFRVLEPRMRADALLCSNTSSITLERLGEALRRPERLLGLHFFNPVARMQLVEIVHTPSTDPKLLAAAAAFVRRIDRLPLPVRSSPGFLVNRILMPYLLEAVKLVEEGIPAALIDRAAVAFGMPMGPVELADRVGLDICMAVAEQLAPVFRLEIPERLRSLVQQRRLGHKSGSGFYRYAKGLKVDETQSGHAKAPDDLTERLIFRLLNEAVACLREGLVQDGDLLDAGVVFGTGFAPFRGGPIHYIQAGGLDRSRQQLDRLAQRHGEQFHPDAGWLNLRGV
jgi:3-hydroxyacyl-CoA dehydrogenase/enoyl-CoA hydratase/3-hydroxybutyryl-CoA epimerase